MRALLRVLSRLAVTSSVGAFAIAACTHTTDRVVEPIGGGDASTTSPEVSDGSTTPIGPIAPIEPADDFRLVRSPEFGAGLGPSREDYSPLRLQVGGGGVGSGGTAGMGLGGNDHRPVSSGGASW